jgi:hypothetical protein
MHERNQPKIITQSYRRSRILQQTLYRAASSCSPCSAASWDEFNNERHKQPEYWDNWDLENLKCDPSSTRMSIMSSKDLWSFPGGALHLLPLVFLPYLLWGAVRWPALWHVLPKFAYCPPFQHIGIQSSHWIKAGGAGTVFEDSIARHLI